MMASSVLRDPLSWLYENVIRYLSAGGEEAAGQHITAFLGNTWVRRGIHDAAGRLGLQEDEFEAGGTYSFAYAVGALTALRGARTILSDPAVRGREIEAMALIEAGLDHAEVLSALRVRASRSSNSGEVGTILQFRR